MNDNNTLFSTEYCLPHGLLNVLLVYFTRYILWTYRFICLLTFRTGTIQQQNYYTAFLCTSTSSSTTAVTKWRVEVWSCFCLLSVMIGFEAKTKITLKTKYVPGMQSNSGTAGRHDFFVYRTYDVPALPLCYI